MAESATLRSRDLEAAMVTFRELLERYREPINRLNVYPVPDGDTGTNMALTLQAVVDMLASADDESWGSVLEAMRRGSLLGARGNSGVILSQVLRALADRLGQADGAVGGAEVAQAIQDAALAARHAVMRPVEGTVLSVLSAAAAAAVEAASRGEELPGVLAAARHASVRALEATPSQLSVLAEAGVVDAGGAGICLLFDALGAAVGAVGEVEPAWLACMPDGHASAPSAAAAGGAEEQAGGLRYEVMFLLEAKDEAIGAFKEVWAGLGDSIVVVGGDGLWNCHVHTDDIGGAIEAGIEAGRPRSIRVTDLFDQVGQLEEERWVAEAARVGGEALVPEAPTGVVAVAAGDGVARILRSLGVRVVVRGGQTMNPSTEELLAAIEEAGGSEVVVLPNNPNVVPVARQAAELAAKPVALVPTRQVLEGFAALMDYDPEASASENAERMARAAERVRTGAVTRAVRSQELDGVSVSMGDWLGLVAERIVASGADLVEVASEVLERLLSPGGELVTLIWGEGATRQATATLERRLREAHPDVEVEVHRGGQPVYAYLLGVE
jgi:DAK2 domain fusion protein YloV